MQSTDIVAISKKMRISVNDLYDFLSKAERLDPRELILLAEQFTNRAVITLENRTGGNA